MRAVILAAGMGTRLAQMTETVPKPLVPVAGRPMLHRAIECLGREGITEAVLVVGYMADAIRDSIGQSFAGVNISYVDNAAYATTSNLRSLWLARDFMDGDSLLLEADLVFEDEVIGRMLAGPADSMALDVYQPFMDGSAVVVEDGQAKELILKAQQGKDFTIEGKFKTVNIYRWSGDFLRGTFLPALDEANEFDDKSLYYEKVLAELIRDGAVMHAVSMAGLKWYEIDNMDDLRAAEEMLA